MTVRQLAQTLSELPVTFSDSKVEFGSRISVRNGVTGWTDKTICAVYANPDRADVTLCAEDVAEFLEVTKPEFLMEIPVFL